MLSYFSYFFDYTYDSDDVFCVNIQLTGFASNTYNHAGNFNYFQVMEFTTMSEIQEIANTTTNNKIVLNNTVDNHMEMYTNGVQHVDFDPTGAVTNLLGNFVSTSDSQLKQNILPMSTLISDPFASLAKLEPKVYEMIHNPGK